MRFLLFILLLCLLNFPVLSMSTQLYSEAVPQQIFPEKHASSPQNIFIFSPQALQWAVYNRAGVRVGIGKGVGGADFCADIKEPCRTVEGIYHILRKKDANCISKTYPIDEVGGAPMPHCMFFYRGYAIHGSNSLPDINSSHGCIRVKPEAAEWMNKNYMSLGSMVIILPYKKNKLTFL